MALTNPLMAPTVPGQPPQRAPFQLGGGQVYTAGGGQAAEAGGMPGVGMNYMRPTMMPNEPDFPGDGGWNPPTPVPSPTPAPTPTPPPIMPPGGALPTVPPGGVPPTPVAAPSLGPTAENPLAPLGDYQAQQRTSSFQAPSFQGGNGYQAGSYNAPQVGMPQLAGYNAQQSSVPQVNQGFAAGQYNAPQVGQQNYQSGNTQAQGVGARNATAGQFDVNAFRPFADAVYSEQTRQLNPQFQAQEAQFRQRMVNQGIQEGTPAFDTAYANFERSRNDAYGSARNQALAQALGAQNQFFGQNLANSQMGLQASMANASNGLQAAGLNQQDRQFGANLQQQGGLANAQMALQAMGMGQADRQFGANLGFQGQAQNASNFLQSLGLGQADRQFGANLGLQGQQMGLQAALANAGLNMQGQQMGQQDRQFGSQMGLQYDQMANAFNQQNAQFGANMGLQYDQMGQQDRQFGSQQNYQQSQADMQMLMQLLGYGNQTTQYNNQLLGQDQQRAGSLFGLIPGLAPTQLDVMGPVNNWTQQQMAINQNQTAQQNGQYQALGQMAQAAVMLSDRDAKTDISRVGTLDNGLPVYVYRYKHGGPMQIGVMAQDVEQVKPHAVAEIGGFKHVNYAEAAQ